MGLPVRCTHPSTIVAEGDGFYFYKLRPWSSFPWLARTVIRLLYKVYHWNTHDGSFESQGFYDVFKTVEEAQAFAEERGWGIQQMPKNQELPDETSQYGYNDIPGSKAKWVTVNRRLTLVTIRRDYFTELGSHTRELREIL